MKRIVGFLLVACMAVSNFSAFAQSTEQNQKLVEIYNADFDSFNAENAAHGVFDNALKISSWEQSVAAYKDSVYFARNPNGEKEDIVVRGLCRTNNAFSMIFNAEKAKEQIQSADKLYFSADVYLDENFTKNTTVSFWTTPFNDPKGTIARFSFNINNKQIITEGEVAYSGEILNKWHTIGVLVDVPNKTVSYYYNNLPVTGAQMTTNAWNGTLDGLGRFIYATLNSPSKDCNMYFNNVYCFDVPEYIIESDLNETVEFPDIITMKAQDGTEKEINVLWESNSVNSNVEGEYTVFGRCDYENAIVTAKVKVADSLKREMTQLRNKMNERTASDKECAELAKKIKEKNNYLNAEEYLNEIENYIKSFSDKVINYLPNLNEKINAKTNKITLSYERTIKSFEDISLKDEKNNEINVSAELSDDGKSIEINIGEKLNIYKEYLLTLTGIKDIFDFELQEEAIKFRTCMLSVNIENENEYGAGKKISWDEDENISIKCSVKKIGDTKSVDVPNNYKFEELGQYEVTLNANNGAEVETYVIFILEAIAPKANNVKISGIPETGEVIKASYEFYDKNNDEEKGSIFEWYRDNELIEGANSKEYILTQQDENHIIYFKITPKADSEYESVGETVTAEFTGAYSPAAQNVKISGDVKFGSLLTGEFEIHDKNGDDTLIEPTYKWVFENDKGEKSDVGNEKTLTLKEEYVDGNLFFEITPKSNKKPCEGESVQVKIAAPARAKAIELTVKGNAAVGNILSGTYTWYDVNYQTGDREGKTIERWIDAKNGNIISNSAAITLTSDLAGKTIYYEVVPYSIDMPYEGIPAKSEEIYVKKNTDSGGGASSGGSSNSRGQMIVQPQPNVTEDENKPNNENKIFYDDIENHWAKEYIIELSDKKVITGTGNNKFDPQRYVTRAEFVTMIMRLKGIKEVEYNQDFEDVLKSHWASGYIKAALDNGIIAKDTTFNPDTEIKREEAAKILSLISNTSEQEEVNTNISDREEISEWAIEYVDDCIKKGIFAGDENGRFNSKSSLTRAEAAVVLWRLK